jgi:hypothetical protein
VHDAGPPQCAALDGVRRTSVDDLTWEPGWVAVPDGEQRRRFQRVCAGDEWVLAGYGAWLDVPLQRVQLVVALDYPRWFSLQRLVRRTFRRLLDFDAWIDALPARQAGRISPH